MRVGHRSATVTARWGAAIGLIWASGTLAAPPVAFRPEVLSEGVLLFRPVSVDGRTNSLVVEQERGLVVIEAQPSPAAARELVEAIRQRSAKPIRFLVISHPHLEVAGGASAFGEGPIVVASLGSSTALGDPAYDFGAEVRARSGGSAEWIEPPRPSIDLVVSGRVVLADAKRPVAVIATGHAHSVGDLIVQLPQQDIAYAGALLFGDGDPWAGDADVGNWLAALNSIVSEGPRVLVPLRGAPPELDDVRKQRDALAWLRGQVEEGFVDRLPPEQIHQRVIEHPGISQRFATSAASLGILIDRVIEEGQANRLKRGQM